VAGQVRHGSASPGRAWQGLVRRGVAVEARLGGARHGEAWQGKAWQAKGEPMTNWELTRTIAYRDDHGKPWKLTLIWVNTNTLEEKRVHLHGESLRYVQEVAA